jgi:HSP20 family molecular chaperone IbpA
MSLTPLSSTVHKDLGVLRRPIELFLSDFNNYFQQSSPSSVWEDDTTYNIEAEVPGFSQEQLDIKLDGQNLSITGVRASSDSRRSQKSCVSYSYFVPRYVRLDEMSANLSNGLLSITAPKDSSSRVRKIQVISK